ncbi:hypothetical protein, partial [Pseudomonas sp. UBA5706]|uniref:hypothetical protein n=1 Tax=Pseudomonas sp. UBA5706 TaxID=1947321 RepID=UPI0025D2E2F3
DRQQAGLLRPSGRIKSGYHPPRIPEESKVISPFHVLRSIKSGYAIHAPEESEAGEMGGAVRALSVDGWRINHFLALDRHRF